MRDQPPLQFLNPHKPDGGGDLHDLVAASITVAAVSKNLRGDRQGPGDETVWEFPASRDWPSNPTHFPDFVWQASDRCHSPYDSPEIKRARVDVENMHKQRSLGFSQC